MTKGYAAKHVGQARPKMHTGEHESMSCAKTSVVASTACYLKISDLLVHDSNDIQWNDLFSETYCCYTAETLPMVIRPI